MLLLAETSGSSAFGSLLLPLLLVAAFWFLLIRPQRARLRQMGQVRQALAPGARVVTTAGLHATVTSVDDGTVLLEIAPGVTARFEAGAVVRVEEPAPEALPPDETAG